MVQNLETLGFTVVPFGQGFKDMSPPTKELMKLTLEERISHGGHPVLRWMMDNIFIRTHNTDLKNRLTAYSRKHPAVCKLTDIDPDTGCKEFEIEKGRFSFRLTAPYREERRRAASEAAKNE